jgi:hypothetical protein
MLYNLHASNLALRAIRFKFYDRLKQRSIGFQSVTAETAQNDKHFCTYRCSVAVTPHVSKPHDYVNHMFTRL